MKRKNKRKGIKTEHAIAMPVIDKEAEAFLNYQPERVHIPWFDKQENDKYWKAYFEGKCMLD